MRELPFTFDAPLSFFEKADAPAGKQKRIAGVVSTESKDRQDEIVLQRGLDFSDFVQNGWYNDNHTKDTDGILGYPEFTKPFKKGEKLPDGTVAKVNGTWAEGYLLDTEKANRIYELGKALQKTGRRLGFSIEGRIERREGPGKKVIAKALVRNVAITNCPVNTDSRLEIVAKSLQAVEKAEPSDLEKMLTMGPATPGQAIAGSGPRTGTGAGAILAPQSLEHDKKKRKPKRQPVQKALTDEEAIAWVQNRIPGMSNENAMRFITATRALKARGQL